jgi:hypothetical protein
MKEDLHTVCTRSASLLHTRGLVCCEGPRLAGSVAWFGCGKPTGFLSGEQTVRNQAR